MSLTPQDLQLHAALGISDDLLREAKIRRVDDREGRELLGVRNHHGDLGGVLYPRLDPLRLHPVGYRIRRDHPEVEGGKPKNKYMSSIDRAHAFFAPGAAALLADTSTTVAIVESEKAALAITSAAARVGRQVLAVALGGCWGFKCRTGKVVDQYGARVDEHGILPDLDRIAWRDRDVTILFDGDASTNSSVKAARRGLAKELTGRSARVRSVDVPPDAGVSGPDDYLRKHGDTAFWTLFDRAESTAAPVHKRTDAGNGELFASLHADDVRFDHAAQIWRVWTGHHWATDRDGAVRRMAKDALRARLQAAAALTQDEERKREAQWALQSESRRGLDAMLAIAQSERPLAVTGDDWDKHPMLIAVQNGVVNLETGTLRAGRPDDYITRVAPVAYDPEARCPRWEQFMREIFATHPEIADYMQRVFGYSLTGLTTEQAIWILFGVGANGKSTLIETLMHTVFGAEFAWTMPFPSASWTDSMSEYQKATLAGRRFVTSSEVAKQGRLNEELIKSLTGSDSVNARHPYGRPFTFIPQAKFFLRVNDKPAIRDESHGMWRRIKLVPFLETFAVDTTLGAELAAEAPGIMAWAVRGCLDWRREGLCEPAIVQAATAEYRDENDQISEFIAARCVVLDGVSVRAGALYEAYRSWASDNVPRIEDRLSMKAFTSRVKTRFESQEKRHTVYFGIGIAANDDQEAA